MRNASKSGSTSIRSYGSFAGIALGVGTVNVQMF